MNRQAGFTLIELMVTLSVVVILTTIAVPGLATFIKNGRLVTETNDLITDLSFARAESARRGKRVAICLSTNGTACASGANWAGGRIIFLDGGTAGTVDGADEVFRYKASEAGSKVSLTASGFGGTTNFLQFRSDGSISAGANGQFKICDDRAGNFGRIVQVLASGRAVLTTQSGSYASCP